MLFISFYKAFFMQTTIASQNVSKRIASIDILRGLVMLIMLVDHVRERFFYHQNITDPMTLDATSTELFFTRLSAHLCAPTFVFLAGLSTWLYANPANKPPRSATRFLFTRGLFLILIEVTLVNFSWFGAYHALYLQVIWAIGISMIMLSLGCRLPRYVIGLAGFVIVFGHNALSFVEFQPDEFGYHLWTILHDRGYLYTSETFKIKASYPVLPWIGVIFLGYFAGPIYRHTVDALARQKALIVAGVSSLLLLLILRYFNVYGEALPWATQANTVDTVKDFLNYTKYPPSLDYLLLTLGVAMLILAALENSNHKLSKMIEVFGSAPMFFYILHLYVLLASYRILENVFGKTQGDYWGVDHVWQLWAIAGLLAVLLYWPVKQFSALKQSRKYPWLKYF